jgi:sortase (surface protein transpeptidase)
MRHSGQEKVSMSNDHDAARATRSRRALIAAAGGSLVAASAFRVAFAQDGDDATAEATPPIIVSNQPGEIPTYGGARTAPYGTRPQSAETATAIPVAIAIEAIGVQATIETLQIDNGTMENPTGPWVVSWYRETAELGEIGNVVLAGHVDYWNVGPAVFYDIRDLAEGDTIVVTGENGTDYTYAVETNEIYDVNALINGGISEIVAATEVPTLTLITCGGEFDYQNGEYLSRTVVRATIAPDAATPPA